MYFRDFPGDSVVKLNASTAGVMGSTCGWGTKIPQAVRYGKKKKKNVLQNLQKCSKCSLIF